MGLALFPTAVGQVDIVTNKETLSRLGLGFLDDSAFPPYIRRGRGRRNTTHHTPYKLGRILPPDWIRVITPLEGLN